MPEIKPEFVEKLKQKFSGRIDVKADNDVLKEMFAELIANQTGDDQQEYTRIYDRDYDKNEYGRSYERHYEKEGYSKGFSKNYDPPKPHD